MAFSPDGNMLVGLHLSLQNVLIYYYKGIKNIQNFKDKIFEVIFLIKIIPKF